MQTAKRFRAKENYIHRKVAHRDVLISIGENVANFNGYIELNASAAFLWDRLKDPCTGEELTEALAQEFSAEPAEARADTEEFLTLLQQHDMIEVI